MTVIALPAANEKEDEDMLVPRSDLVEGPQPMAVEVSLLCVNSGNRDEGAKRGGSLSAPEATENNAANQPTEVPRTKKITWKIENFSRITAKRIYSGIFDVGDYKWQILIFPKGNDIDALSMYLGVTDSASLPYGWTRYTHFSLAIVNQVHSKYSVRKETQYQFSARKIDWGFASFMPLGELYDPSRGYLVNDTCLVEAEVGVDTAMDPWLYDSKKETGFVGLKNQGATCYMNSLLQTLYHIPYFRKVVYHMPTNVNDMPSASIPLAMQRLFYKLQYSDTSVATKELTKSFGWDSYESFLQHDVQELNRVLCAKLEEKMKRTVVEGAIQQLFEGHHMNYIECINVDYKSSRKESFYDLQLDVKGCHDVYASFDKYVAVENLDGDNKYHAEQHGLQVLKLTGFDNVMPTLVALTLMYINDGAISSMMSNAFLVIVQFRGLDAKKGVLFIDFPPVLQLHLKRFEYDFVCDVMGKINDHYEFPLQLDLDRDDGKYLSPDADRRVCNLYTLHSVLVHSGGVHGGHYYAFIRPTLSGQWYKFDDERVTKEDAKNALDELYGGGEEEQPMQKIQGVNKFTKHSNAYMLVYIRDSVKDKIMCHVDEKHIAENLREKLKREQEEKEQKRKDKSEAHLYTIVKIGRHVIFDLVNHNMVKSLRVQKLMPFNDFKEVVENEFGIPVQFQRFWLWEKRLNHTLRPVRPLTQDEEAQTVGHLMSIASNVQNKELRLFFEFELGPDSLPIPLPNKEKDDILLFFKLYDPEKQELRYVGRLFVNSLGKPVDIFPRLIEMAGYAPEEDIELYEEIRFYPNVLCDHMKKRSTFRASQLEDGDIVCFQKSLPTEVQQQLRCPDVRSFFEYHHNLQVSDILYYEVLDIPLPELEGLRTLRVAFRHGTNDEMEINSIRRSKDSTVADLLDDLRMKIQLSRPDAELRLLEVFAHKIYKIPEEEKHLGPHDCLIHVYHFMNEGNQNKAKIQNFGEPFLLAIHADEILANVKIRVQKKLQVSDEEFSKWKFAFVSQDLTEYLEDSEILFSRFQSRSMYIWEQYLGLEHKRPLAANQVALISVDSGVVEFCNYQRHFFLLSCQGHPVTKDRVRNAFYSIDSNIHCCIPQIDSEMHFTV
ncbi:hypothetical protein SASPL_119919 [Salvia splendens]|uniref:ubiquitinyl hydrolase 1 n=1 Tax=Salvia splendens TaxID=180675 RepID=A0A8X8XRY7_SALSN|nr:hypothetical protein SASPL_119919 [Salvia splendens]